MTKYLCGSCRETQALSPKARFCPICGSSSLTLVVEELAEPAQKETVGVYKTATIREAEPPAEKEEEDRPRRRSR